MFCPVRSGWNPAPTSMSPAIRPRVHTTTVRGHHPRDQLQQCRLPGPAEPHQPDAVALLGVERHVVDGGERARQLAARHRVDHEGSRVFCPRRLKYLVTPSTTTTSARPNRAAPRIRPEREEHPLRDPEEDHSDEQRDDFSQRSRGPCGGRIGLVQGRQPERAVVEQHGDTQWTRQVDLLRHPAERVLDGRER